jgi:hypothetical protein
MTHTANAVQQKALAWGLVPAVMFAAVVVTPVQSHAQDALRIGDTGNVGLGIDSPERQLHLRGSNATFRMDRSADTAAFLLVRTNPAGTPLKTFVVGTNAAGANNGEFIINDLGTAVSGAGTRRMTINNAGNVIFTGTVSQGSSARYKQDIETLEDARAALRQLRGVRFIRKDTGRAELGLIAEEVREVFPEVVEVERGAAEAVNYSALVAVLVEAFKEQEAELAAQRVEVAGQRAELAALRGELAGQQAHVAHLEARLAGFEAVRDRLAEIEGLLAGERGPAVFARR